MRAEQAGQGTQQPDLAARIAGFPRWHYQFELQGLRTPADDPATVNRHRQRQAYMLPPLLAECGGSLSGLRVLDLGCNAGLWSLRSIEAGAQKVVGVDARAMHIEQAELVFEAHEVDRPRYDFIQADVLELDPLELGGFDVVLCLGLLYHVADPVGLMKLIARSGARTAVLDTSLARGWTPRLAVRWDDAEDPRDAVRGGLVLVPTRAAVREMAAACRFQTRELRPRFSDWEGAGDYRRGRRRAFILRREEGGDAGPGRRARRRRLPSPGSWSPRGSRRSAGSDPPD